METVSLPISLRWSESEPTLNGLAQVIPPPLLVDDRLVDLARGQVVVSREPDVEEPLVVPQIQVHLASIVQHKHLSCAALAGPDQYHWKGSSFSTSTFPDRPGLTVLVGRERAGVDVDVRVDLDGGHVQAARLEDRAHAARDDALPDAGDHSAGDQDVFHGGALVPGPQRNNMVNERHLKIG